MNTGKMISQVRVQALHADACAAHATASLCEFDAHRRGVPSLRIVVVRALEILRVHELFESVHAAFALEPTHGSVQIRIHEPVERGHWRAIAQVRLVFYDDGAAVVATNNDREASRGRSTEERFNNELVVEGRVVKRQRQNSSVRTRRDTNPARWLDVGADLETVSGAAAVGETSGWNPGSEELASPAEFSGNT